MGGNELWISTDLEGVAAGSPVVSDDGGYVFLTHNADGKKIGYFTALWAASNGTTFYSASDEDAPFAPPGIFHNPAEGFYDGGNGVGNMNDVIMWANAVQPGATTIGTGTTYVFQFPVGFDNTAVDIGFFVLGDMAREFLGASAPVITNEGRSVYYSISRSGFVCWVGEEGLPREYFSRAATRTVGFTRNSGFPGTPVFASPALSSDSAQPVVFGGSASAEFVRMTYDLSSTLAVDTTSHIMAEAKVDPGDRTVYFVESSGMLHSVNFNNIQNRWSFDVGFSVEGDMAMSADGSVLYIGDTRGMITAVQVAEIAPTPEPSSLPTALASESPSSAPSVPTEPPSGVPTGVPTTDVPTQSPTASPTKAPVEAPTSEAPVVTGTPVEFPTDAPTDDDDTPADGDSSASRTPFFASIALVAACLLI
jgi:plastocyanin